MRGCWPTPPRKIRDICKVHDVGRCVLSRVTECISCAHKAGEHLCKTLLGPAVLDAAKMVRLVHCTLDPCGDLKSASILRQILFCCESHLPGIFDPLPEGSSLATIQRRVEDSHRKTSGSYSSGSRGGGVDRDRIPRVRVINIQLMSALRKLNHTSAPRLSKMLEHTQCMCYLAYSSTAGQRQADAHKKRFPDALGMAHHCSFQVLIWMKQQKKKQEQQRPERPVTSSQRRQKSRAGI